MPKWRVLSLDVWGNPEDGFEVNDRYGIGKIELPEDYTDAQLLRVLKDAGFVRPYVTLARIEIEDDGAGLISLDQKKDGRPVFQLERED
jgi:hypothetical protein